MNRVPLCFSFKILFMIIPLHMIASFSGGGWGSGADGGCIGVMSMEGCVLTCGPTFF